MQAKDNHSGGLAGAALLAVVGGLTGLAGAVKIAQSAVNLGPGVGDILMFDPVERLPRDLRTTITVARPGQPECVMDLDAVHRNGGSLIVEERVLGERHQYRVHWAGNSPDAGSGTCGSSADLLMDDSNLDLLAMAAGGWGVRHKRLMVSSLWSGGGTSPRTQKKGNRRRGAVPQATVSTGNNK